jgi:glycosyltransferase involved in cell wall biosynthesis
MPFFSIIIPIYNTNRVLLEKCFDSIKKQIFVDYEIIVINDCSVNIETIAFIKNLINVKIINNVDNLGLAMSRNIGINYSNGQYIVFCDSDDYLSPDALDIMHHYIKHIPNLDILSYEVVFCKNDALYKPKNGRTNTLYHKLTNFELQPVIIQNRVPV